MQTKDFILASGSPQRRALLESIGMFPKDIRPAGIDETPFSGEEPLPYIRRMALSKAQLERYTKQFQNPERFFRVGGEIKAVPYKPEKDHER